MSVSWHHSVFSVCFTDQDEWLRYLVALPWARAIHHLKQLSQAFATVSLKGFISAMRACRLAVTDKYYYYAIASHPHASFQDRGASNV